jgi:serine protease Do
MALMQNARPAPYPDWQSKITGEQRMSSTMLQNLNQDLSAVVTQGWESLVSVSDGDGAGAGTIWHEDGLIVTNAHVVLRRDARGNIEHKTLTVTLRDGRQYPAQVLAFDVDQDLAALSIAVKGLPTSRLGHSRDVCAGQWVTALGHPWGVQGAATSGIVIGVGNQLPELPNEREWIVLGLHLRPGHSGGPLLNSKGELIGINTMITGPDVGFAIPIDTVKAFLRAKLHDAQG